MEYFLADLDFYYNMGLKDRITILCMINRCAREIACKDDAIDNAWNNALWFFIRQCFCNVLASGKIIEHKWWFFVIYSKDKQLQRWKCSSMHECFFFFLIFELFIYELKTIYCLFPILNKKKTAKNVNETKFRSGSTRNYSCMILWLDAIC